MTICRVMRPFVVTAVFCFAGMLVPHAAGAREIWFAPLDPVWRGIHSWPANDYMELFMPNAPWPDGARNVKVFEVYKKFLEQATDADLMKMINALTRQGIALAVQGTPLVATKECGRAVEGYGPPHDMAAIAARVKQLGGTISYVVLDEPLYYGHDFNGRPPLPYETRGPTPCHATIADLAGQAAAKMAEVRAIFPAVKVGDIEPVGVFPEDDDELAGEIAQWIAAYRAASPEGFAFFQLDAAWLLPRWRAQFDTVVRCVRNAALPLGVIYNGTRADTTDAAWLASARSHIQRVESSLGGAPDQAIFQNWTDHPRQMLPETSSTAFTNLLKEYAQGR